MALSGHPVFIPKSEKPPNSGQATCPGFPFWKTGNSQYLGGLSIKTPVVMQKKWTYWFEIPAADFDRAKAFYEKIFDMEIAQVFDAGAFKMGIFPEGENVGCAICWGGWYKPSPDGAVVYFDASPDLKTVEDRIEEAGGKVVQSKKMISEEQGYMALFEDCEGNRFGLRSAG